MQAELLKLGFVQKEIDVYLALIEFGTQPGSVIAKKTGMPKATVLFLFDHLNKKGYIRKSQRGRTQYFFADPADLEKEKKRELGTQEAALSRAIPLLHEFKNPFTSQPKVTFFEGLDGCRKAYSLLLESTTEIYEFGAHSDLLKMGRDFMNAFVRERSRRKIFLSAMCKKTPFNEQLKRRDKKDRRSISLYPEKIGELFSSIAVFEDKVLLVNLYQDAFAILIQNREVAETLKAIFRLARGR